MSERIWYLKRCSLFQSISQVEIGRLEARCRMRTFPRGTLVYTPRDSADDVLLLASGRIKVHAITDDGKQAILAFIEPGEIFGELAVLGTGTREEYAEACQAASVVLIPAEAVHELMETHAQVSLAVTKLIGLRRRRLERRLKSLLFRSTRERHLGERFARIAGRDLQAALCGSEINFHLKRVEKLVERSEDLHDAERLDDLGILGARLPEHLKLGVGDR